MANCAIQISPIPSSKTWIAGQAVVDCNSVGQEPQSKEKSHGQRWISMFCYGHWRKTMRRIKLGVMGSRVQASLGKKKPHMWRAREQVKWAQSINATNLRQGRGEHGLGMWVGEARRGRMSTQMLAPHSTTCCPVHDLELKDQQPYTLLMLPSSSTFPRSLCPCCLILAALISFHETPGHNTSQGRENTQARAQARTEDEASQSSVLKIKSGARGRGGAGGRKCQGINGDRK